MCMCILIQMRNGVKCKSIGFKKETKKDKEKNKNIWEVCFFLAVKVVFSVISSKKSC